MSHWEHQKFDQSRQNCSSMSLCAYEYIIKIASEHLWTCSKCSDDGDLAINMVLQPQLPFLYFQMSWKCFYSHSHQLLAHTIGPRKCFCSHPQQLLNHSIGPRKYFYSAPFSYQSLKCFCSRPQQLLTHAIGPNKCFCSRLLQLLVPKNAIEVNVGR